MHACALAHVRMHARTKAQCTTHKQVFVWLPVAVTVDERTLIIHGGLKEDLSLEDIAQVVPALIILVPLCEIAAVKANGVADAKIACGASVQSPRSEYKTQVSGGIGFAGGPKVLNRGAVGSDPRHLRN